MRPGSWKTKRIRRGLLGRKNSAVPTRRQGSAAPCPSGCDTRAVVKPPGRDGSSNHEAVERRIAFFDAAHRATPTISVLTEDGHLLVDTRDQGVARLLFAKRHRGEMDVLQRAIVVLDATLRGHRITERLFVDVGANIGTSTISALCRHRFAGAVAYEPEPHNYLLLRSNVLLNDVSDFVVTRQMAVTDRTGSVDLVLDPANSGNHRVATGHDRSWIGPDATSVSVPCQSLDGSIAEGDFRADDVGLLWIDAQSSEGDILAGAGELRRRAVPTVLEFHPRMLAEAGTLDQLQLMLQRDYEGFVDLRVVRAEWSRRQLRAAVGPTDRLAELVDRYSAGFTDILVIGGS